MTRAGLRVGLIGAGGISRPHASAWRELGAELTVYSRSGTSNLVEEFGAVSVSSLDELLAVSDVIDICSPTGTHPEFVLAAISAGKPVVCEKPLALTVAEAARLVERAAEAGVPLYPAHVVRFFPEYVRAQQAVQDGLIGTIAVSRFTRMGEYPRWSPWFGDDEQSGGIVLDQMIHDLDLARWISGAVTRVYAVRSGRITDASTVSAQVVLTHAGGALSYATGVWGAPGTVFSTSFSITGSDGVLEHDSRKDGTLVLDIGDPLPQASVRPADSLVESPYLVQLREFVQGIRGELQPRVNADDGVMAVKIARAAIESVRTGRPVELTDRFGVVA